MTIEDVIHRHQARIMSIAGVTGIGEGRKDDKPAVVVMVRQLTPDIVSRIPTLLDGHPVVVEESGEIRAG
ncbi:MAG TPA: hypothetical protein VGN12_05525 [Pirellulales bacterium]|jgi:hypothetical protein